MPEDLGWIVTEVRPLYYVGTPTEEQRLALRAGKESLGVDWLVQPIQAKPGAEGPVLAFETPQFYVDSYAELTPPYTSARMAMALRELYGMVPPDHLTTGEEWLARYLPGIHFIGEVEIDVDRKH
jgi:hypothetical protein